MKKFKGLGILWEHRHYGESLPFRDQFSHTIRCPSAVHRRPLNDNAQLSIRHSGTWLFSSKASLSLQIVGLSQSLRAPKEALADWAAVTKYVDDVLVGNNTAEQITVKRALYTARMSGPGGDTTLVEHLFDSAAPALPSDNMAGVLLDLLD